MSKKSGANLPAVEGATTGGTAAETPVIGSQSVTMDMQTYLASDEKEWLTYLRTPIRPFRKPGVSMSDEYKQWLAARARIRAMVSANN